MEPRRLVVFVVTFILVSTAIGIGIYLATKKDSAEIFRTTAVANCYPEGGENKEKCQSRG